MIKLVQLYLVNFDNNVLFFCYFESCFVRISEELNALALK